MTTRVIITNPDGHSAIEVCEVTHGSQPNHASTYGPGITVPHGGSREMYVHAGASIFVREKAPHA